MESTVITHLTNSRGLRLSSPLLSGIRSINVEDDTQSTEQEEKSEEEEE